MCKTVFKKRCLQLLFVAVSILALSGCFTAKHIKNTGEDFKKGNIGSGLVDVVATPFLAVMDVMTLGMMGSGVDPEVARQALETTNNQLAATNQMEVANRQRMLEVQQEQIRLRQQRQQQQVAVMASVAPTMSNSAAFAQDSKPHSVPSTIQCLEIVNEWRGGISTESVTIHNKCNQKVGFVYCVVSSKTGGAFDCRGNHTGADAVKAGGTNEISVMDASSGRLEVSFAECVNSDPESQPYPKNTHFNGARLVFDGCAF